jgi:hypothetical protein
MQRMAWTDERLEERFAAVDLRFDQVDRRFDEVDRRLVEVQAAVTIRFDEVDRRFGSVDGQLADLRHGLGDLQSVLNRLWIGVTLGLVGVIAAILTSGA